MKNKTAVHGLYAITPDIEDTARLCELVEAYIAGGASIVQYRSKVTDTKLKIVQSTALRDLCHQHGVPFIINDYVNLCQTVDADGVHIGRTDGSLEEIRARLGPDKILGVSCYTSLSHALEAQNKGADYVAFGACFPSETKPNAPRAELDLFTKARQTLQISSVGIGGITLENAPMLIDAGAHAIAVIGALSKSSDPRASAKEFTHLFKKSTYDLTQSATI
jgi:thiamine-phosphate pyrophosphorylase